MDAEERQNLNKALYKIELCLVKIIPIIISILYLTNIILSYFYIDNCLISVIGSVSVLTWLFLYISSHVFRFCKWHRSLLWYIAFNESCAWIDYKIGIPLSNENLFLFMIFMSGLFLLITIYLRFKNI